MSFINITYINLVANTSHILLVGGSSDKEAHKNYCAAKGELVNPLFEVTSCAWKAI